VLAAVRENPCAPRWDPSVQAFGGSVMLMKSRFDETLMFGIYERAGPVIRRMACRGATAHGLYEGLVLLFGLSAYTKIVKNR
jgi:hypothetical protein